MKIRLTAVLAACLMLCGCTDGAARASDPAYRIGVVLKALNSQHWREVQSGMEQAAAELGVELTLLYPRDESAEDEQKLMIRDLLALDGLDALIVSPCNSGDTAWIAREAEARGLPLYMADTRATDCALPYIGADNGRIGGLAAAFLADDLPAGTQVAIIAGSDQQSAHNDRVDGFRRYLERDGRLTIAEVIYTDLNIARAIEAMRDILQSRPEIGGVFCTNAVMGQGAALTQQRMQGVTPRRIVAVDTQDDAIQSVADGRLAALVTQGGAEIGRLAVQTAVRALNGEALDDEIYVESELLTQDEAAAFLAKKKLGEESDAQAAAR